MSCLYDPYTLPTIYFVGGETQHLVFNVYSHRGKRPFSLASCSANFSVVGFLNKTGVPIISKQMNGIVNSDGVDNVLTVTLEPKETLDLSGKYIYEIQIRDVSGIVEIPKQGILYITNNINKGFIR